MTENKQIGSQSLSRPIWTGGKGSFEENYETNKWKIAFLFKLLYAALYVWAL